MDRQMVKAKIFDLMALVLYCAYLYWLSAQPTLKPPFDLGIVYQDKLYHSVAYGIMAFLAWRSGRHFMRQLYALWFGVVFSSLYGITDEWHQWFVPGRSTDWQDWLADTIGAVLMVAILYWQKQQNHYVRDTPL
jgi:VanZ family protein